MDSITDFNAFCATWAPSTIVSAVALAVNECRFILTPACVLLAIEYNAYKDSGLALSD